MSSSGPSLTSDLKLTFVILFCGAVNAINVAKLAPAIPRIQAEFDLSLSSIGVLASLFSMLIVMTGILIGGSVRMIGAKRVLITALVIACIGNIISLLGDTTATLFLGRIIEGVSLVSIILTGPTLLAQHTNARRRGMVMGLWGSFMPLGNAAALLAAPSLLALGSWQALWWAGLIVSGIVTIVAIGAIPPDRPHQNSTFNMPAVLLAMRAPILAILGISFAAHSLVYQSLLQFIPLFTQTTSGFSIVWATGIGALFCLFNCAGNILSGHLLQAGFRPHLIPKYGGLIVGGLLLLLCIFGTEKWVVIVVLLLTGLASGGTPPVLFYIVSQQKTKLENMPVFVAWMFQIQGLGMLTGPALIGLIVDRSENWNYGFLSLIPFCFLISFAARFLRQNASPAPGHKP